MMLASIRSVSGCVSRFARCESGAVTVDWVLLTAAVVAMVIALFVFLTDTVYEDAGLAIASDIDNAVER